MTLAFASYMKSLMGMAGQDAVLLSTTTASRTNSGLTRANTTTSTDIKIAVRFATPKELGSLTYEFQKIGILPAKDLGVVPHKNDRVTLNDGVTYNVVSVDARNYGNEVVAYILYLQGGAND